MVAKIYRIEWTKTIEWFVCAPDGIPAEEVRSIAKHAGRRYGDIDRYDDYPWETFVQDISSIAAYSTYAPDCGIIDGKFVALEDHRRMQFGHRVRMMLLQTLQDFSPHVATRYDVAKDSWSYEIDVYLTGNEVGELESEALTRYEQAVALLVASGHLDESIDAISWLGRRMFDQTCVVVSGAD